MPFRFKSFQYDARWEYPSINDGNSWELGELPTLVLRPEAMIFVQNDPQALRLIGDPVRSRGNTTDRSWNVPVRN